MTGQALNPRLAAARVLTDIIGEGRSLTAALPSALRGVGLQDRGLLQELCYGVLRWHPQLEFFLQRLLKRSLDTREQEVRALLLVGLYQLLHLRLPEYAAVNQTVAAVHSLNKPWAVGLVNAVLRNCQRRRGDLWSALEQDHARYAHPAWLLQRFKTDWPENWPDIVTANNAYPTLDLRVNVARLSRLDYFQRLLDLNIKATLTPFSEAGITLAKACDVEQIPGFREGLVSVQDPAAQLAASLLCLEPGQRVLDACAAPGGKTCHIREKQPNLAELLALDIAAPRLTRIQENLDRLGLDAHLVVGDALKPESWWDGRPFERILLDAPCSATGVIRRHPDIKLLRRATDIKPLAQRQRALLESLWPLLAPGGILIYTTCSVLKQENETVVAGFLAAHSHVKEKPTSADWGQARPAGKQILPGVLDGFYYARLLKTVAA